MADSTPSRLGQANLAGDALALFLKVFAGEVLVAYQTATKTDGRHHERTISHGKSAQFPATWKNTAALHTPGAEILGNLIAHNEIVITIDGLMISPTFIASIDEAMNHYDVRSIYTTESGIALATAKDKNVLRTMLLAARSATATVTGSPAAIQQFADASMKTSASILASAIFNATQLLDENDVPESQVRSCFVRPAQYYLLVQNKDLLNKDWGGRGSLASAELPEVAGVQIVKTNNLPITDESADGSVLVKYRGNWTNVAAVVSTPWAAGTVKLRDLMTESQYDIRRQGHLAVAKYAMGHGILRKECAVQLVTTAN
jgi:hypothetical protein